MKNQTLIAGALATVLGAASALPAQADDTGEPRNAFEWCSQTPMSTNDDARTRSDITEAGLRLAAGLGSSDQVVIVYWGNDPAREAEINHGACDAYVAGIPLAGILLANAFSDGGERVSVYAGAGIIREFPVDGRDLRSATREAAEYANRTVFEHRDVVAPDLADDPN